MSERSERTAEREDRSEEAGSSRPTAATPQGPAVTRGQRDRPEPQRSRVDVDAVRFGVGVFLVLGVGTAVAFLLGAVAPSGVAGSSQSELEFLGAGLGTMLLLYTLFAPVVAALLGVEIARRVPGGDDVAALSAGVATGSGFVAMVVPLLALLAVIGTRSASILGDTEVFELLPPLVAFAVGVCLIGATSAAVARWW